MSGRLEVDDIPHTRENVGFMTLHGALEVVQQTRITVSIGHRQYFYFAFSHETKSDQNMHESRFRAKDERSITRKMPTLPVDGANHRTDKNLSADEWHQRFGLAHVFGIAGKMLAQQCLLLPEFDPKATEANHQRDKSARSTS